MTPWTATPSLVSTNKSKIATRKSSVKPEYDKGKLLVSETKIFCRPSSIPKHARKGAKEVVVNNFHLEKMTSNLAGLFNEICGADDESYEMIGRGTKRSNNQDDN